MKIQKYNFFKPVLFITVLLIIFLINCPVTENNSEGGDNGSSSSTVPVNVDVTVDGDNIIVSWDPVDGAVSYQLYILMENLDYNPVEEAVIPGGQTTYIDTDVPGDQKVGYALRCVVGGNISPLSKCSPLCSLYVLDLEISKLEYDDKIVLNWEKHDNASGYNIYRYLSKNVDPELIESGYTGTEYIDTAVDANKPYFYQITWIEGGIENGTDSPAVLGVKGTMIDYLESNDSLQDAAGPLIEDDPTVPDDSYDSIIYSFANKDDDVFSDEDYYYYEYKGYPQAVTVTVTLPAGTLFNYGELKFRFYNNGAPASEPENIFYLVDGINNFTFDDYNSWDTDIYFKIYTDVDSSRSVIGTYEVKIKEGL